MNRTIIAFSLLGCLLAAAPQALAEVPMRLSYQGFLTDSVGNPVTGTWTITFSLFTQPTGGVAFYETTRDAECLLGIFSVEFGDEAGNEISAEPFIGGEVYLELIIETDGGPVPLSPRQRVVSNPYSLASGTAQVCDEAMNAAQLDGTPAGDYVTTAQLPDLCITDGNLESKLDELGIGGGTSYTDEDVAAFLDENGFSPCACYGDVEVGAFLVLNGYEPGPLFSGQFADLEGVPALVTGDEAVVAVTGSGAVLLSDGTVALQGHLDAAGYQLTNLVIHNATIEDPPADPAPGQLWWDTSNDALRVYDGETWVLVGEAGTSSDLACQGCVDSDDVAFNYAGAAGKGGAAINSLDVNCAGCVDSNEVDFAWAKGMLPGGDAEHAVSAGMAQDLQCAACVQAGEIDPAALDAKLLAFNDGVAGLGANNVQTAIEQLAVNGGGAGGFQEGNGTIVPYVEQWGLPAYGEATTYVHLMNPTTPKVLMHLYAGDPSGFSTSNNLVVAYSFSPNQYSGAAAGTAGEMALQVGNPSLFTVGAHLLIHQTVGKNGNGTDANKWELNQVLAIEGSTLLLAKALKHTYVTCGDDCGRAQAVVAASYNQLEIVNGGVVQPSTNAHDNSDRRGSIIYIRARKIVVKTGGRIQADYYSPFRRGDNWGGDYRGENASSECLIHDNQWGPGNNCSGGGGGGKQNNDWTNTGGGGGGGNKTAGENGHGAGGNGGSAIGDDNGDLLTFGGSGGSGYYGRGGVGGGIVVLGAETIIVETGASITANGQSGDCPWGNSTSHSGGGSGAGGSIVLYADSVINNGTIEAAPGEINDCSNNGGQQGGIGGEGWVIEADPVAGVVNESYAKGVEIWVDEQNVTGLMGDPNGKGEPAWDDDAEVWGASGLNSWSSGPLDLTSVANWTLGEHKIQLKETGGAGGDVKMFTYVIYPFSGSSAPTNDSCEAPIMLDVTGPTTVTGTTEDVMGKIKATDANTGPFCGGSGGPDVVYGFVLEEWRQLTVHTQSAFAPRVYIRKGNCAQGDVVACGQADFTTATFEPGTYYLIVDSDGNLQKGDFSVTVTPTPPDAPPNDTCGQPELLNFQGGMAQTSGMTLFSVDDYSAACGGAGAAENVYQFTVPANTSKLSVLIEADFNPALYLSKEICTSAPIACIPAAQYEMGWPGAGTYYLFVDGKNANDKGLYSVTVALE